MKIKLNFMNFSNKVLPPRNEIPNMFINLIFQWYEKSWFYWAKKYFLLCAATIKQFMTMNPLNT